MKIATVFVVTCALGTVLYAVPASADDLTGENPPSGVMDRPSAGNNPERPLGEPETGPLDPSQDDRLPRAGDAPEDRPRGHAPAPSAPEPAPALPDELPDDELDAR